ncbi:hypothetical protein CRC11_003966 [Salmonella enterica subsp. enterica serovar Enteritidis]|nr:hypothetical protein [Salmonella enterica subsp. enterica]EDU3510841.1 hypothetical protein [Salmonella enterica subsp. enterica serovar Enteritidis]EEG7527668.1 hypothetical protein [Salmonella enterica]TNK49095.1 hypothetical protein CI641_023285 [Escherichia coli]
MKSPIATSCCRQLICSGVRAITLSPWIQSSRHCCKVSDEAAFCLIQRPYISKTLLTRRISPRGSP